MAVLFTYCKTYTLVSENYDKNPTIGKTAGKNVKLKRLSFMFSS